MIKHIVGLLVFSLIVGTSVIVAGIFGYFTVPTAKTVKVKENYKVYKKKKRKKRCRKKRPRPKQFSAAVSQATYDAVNNSLTTQLTFTGEDFSRGKVDLHFFVKDSYGTQYLKKESIYVSSDKNIYENSFGWLNRLESKDNLYVIPVVRKYRHRWSYTPDFNKFDATPVLLSEVK